MSFFDTIIKNLPQVEGPKESKLGFGPKTKWTLIVLLAYFFLKAIPLYGFDTANLPGFEQFSLILGSEIGSLVTLGIGPIVTASIVLQLLNGSGLVKFDTSSPSGRARFQGYNKLLAIAFIIAQAVIFVAIGGVAPSQALLGTPQYFTLQVLLVIQVILGGFLIMFLDDISQKWGFGSGISLFIAAGVSESLLIRLLSWFTLEGQLQPTGAIPAIFFGLTNGDSVLIFIEIFAIVATILVFLLVIYFQSMKVEIPLSFGRVRGHGIRWPLSFMYTSNMPVILVFALIANLQFFGNMLANALSWQWLVTLTQFFTAPNIFGTIISNIINTGDFIGGFNIGSQLYIQALIYTLILMGGSVLFSWFWMQTAGMDAKSQAKKIMQSGLQIPGFRKDPRIMEHVLNRYIGPLTVMGGLTVGFLAAIADVSGALTSGTGLLLAVMIIYRMYEDIAKKHMAEMNPQMQKFMGK